jgi:hypothetical protein
VKQEDIGELRERAIKELAVLNDVGHARVLEYLHAIEMDRGELLTALRVGRGHGQKPLIQNGHRVLYAAAPPREHRGVGVVEDLGMPPALEKHEQEEEPSLDAPSVQEGDLVSGLEGDESGGGHGPPGFSLEYVTRLIEMVRGDFEYACAQDYKRARTALGENEFRVLADWHEKTRVDAVRVVCSSILGQLKAAA